ncbi:MAG: M24 family metallopeptidase [Acidimicrobiales bacterium]|nr:M24 family metallopeptidase [Acidimicrobiales bacterium]
MAAETLPDPEPLRVARRDRLRAAMDKHELDLLVLGRVANIRYASGVPVLWNAGTRPFGPGCVIARATDDVYVLSTWDEGVPKEIPHDHLFGITWNPMNYVEVVKTIAAELKPRRVGTDANSPLFAQLLPMALEGAEIVDGGPALRDARRIKVADEVDAIRRAVAVAERGLEKVIAEIEPGATERSLTGAFMDAMASEGVTTPATQDVVRVMMPSRHPDGVLAAGDLVRIDGGVVVDGYSGDVGRTWRVGSAGDYSGATELFRRGDDLRARLLEACRPGGRGGDLLEAYRLAGEAAPTRPVAYGLGLGFDDPVITPDLPLTAGAEPLDPGVVIAVSAVVADGHVGAVASRDVVQITETGPEVLTTSPFWNPA